MTATVSCDHAGAEALARIHQRAVASGTELRLVITAPVIRLVWALTRLDRPVSIYPTVVAAQSPDCVLPLPSDPVSAGSDGAALPEEGLTIHAFLGNLANGGYVLVEAAEPGVVQSFVSKFIYWNDVKIVPVIDIAETVGTAAESLAWARAASSG